MFVKFLQGFVVVLSQNREYSAYRVVIGCFVILEATIWLVKPQLIIPLFRMWCSNTVFDLYSSAATLVCEFEI